MKKTNLFAVLALAATPAFLHAQTTNFSDVVGYIKLPLKAGSDTIISPQILRPSELSASVSSVSGSGATAVLTLDGVNSLSTNQFVYTSGSQPKTYLVIVTSGALTGTYFSVASNTASTITINLDGLTVGTSDVTAIEVRPCWTLNTLFPPSDANVSFTPSLGVNSGTRRTTILIPDYSTNKGVNRSASATYFYNTNASVQDWVTTAATGVKAGDKAILPGEYVIHRNSGGTPVDLAFTHAGNVLAKPLTYYVDTSATGQNDNYLALPRPTDYTLAELGLTDAGFVQSTGKNTGTRKDVLLVVSVTGTNLNRSATSAYFKFQNDWYSTANTASPTNNAVIPAGSALIIRKSASDGNSKIWTNNLNVNL